MSCVFSLCLTLELRTLLFWDNWVSADAFEIFDWSLNDLFQLGDDANDVDSYEEDYYSGDAMFIDDEDDARYEFLHNDSDDSGDVLVSLQQAASMTFIFNAFLNVAVAVITPRQVTTVAATDGAEFFTSGSKRDMENLLSKKSVKDALEI
ncbi:hypothetical protein L1987_55615 [Smallanthus sonchifolius]|uniref:Uncharacterized protein n=1 Tax=Smallanthus sonchifolius TaxID=185202 RepID=A0ACB9EB39_9ASTR|nr:hypothetical protein L1987_55615 [Smallanthus sonchifolius]